MPARPVTTRESVVQLRNSGCLTWKQIVKQTGVKERTAKRWYQQWKEKGRVFRKTSSGRPRIVRTERNIQRISKSSKGKRRKSVRKLAKQLEGVGSKSTVHRVLRDDLGYKPVRIKRRVKLTDDQKEH